MSRLEERQRARNTVHADLRMRTRADHEAVDTAFAAFDLQTRAGYAAFLTAHARLVPALETRLAPSELLDGWHGRAAALLSDLDALDVPHPATLTVDVPTSDAARWGALYVLEGSRLGGAFLAKRVGAGLPTAYLSAVHSPGAWQHILAAIEQAATGPDWTDEAVAAAGSVFAAYRAAARG